MKIKILSTSDVHGYLYPTNYSTKTNVAEYGMLKAAGIIKRYKQTASADDIVIAIENGDWIQGSPLTSYVVKKLPVAKQSIFSQITADIGYDAGVLGNHEFNYGLAYLRSTETERNYPLLGANIKGGRAQHIVDQPYQIIEQQGVKIAILGLTTAFVPRWERAEHLPGLKFESALATAKKWVPKLRKMADVVVVSYHGGLEYDPHTGLATEPLTNENEGSRILTEVSGIDALITGHQHRQIAQLINGVPVTQPGERGQMVGLIELQLNADNQVTNSTAKLLATATEAPDPTLMSNTLQLENDMQHWLDQPLGRVVGDQMIVTDPLKARLEGHAYLQFINQVQMAATKTDIAATALFNDEVHGYGSVITIRQVLNSYVYPNTLVVERISGADLKLALERSASYFALQANRVVVAAAFLKPKVQHFNYDFYSGIEYTFDLNRPVGERVIQLQYHGQPVTPNQTLLITMNQYRGNGGGDYPMFSTDKVVREVNMDMTELITDYLEKHPLVVAQQPQNFTVKY